MHTAESILQLFLTATSKHKRLYYWYKKATHLTKDKQNIKYLTKHKTNNQVFIHDRYKLIPVHLFVDSKTSSSSTKV